MDNEFDALKPHLDTMNTTLNTTTVSKNVPEIDRHIRIVKEHARAICNLLLFNIFTNRLIYHMISYVVFFLNTLLLLF